MKRACKLIGEDRKKESKVGEKERKRKVGRK